MENLLKTTQELFKISKTEREIENLLKLNKGNILLILSKLKEKNLSIGEKSKLENLLSIFKSFGVQIRKQRIGSGLATSHTAAAGPSTSNHNDNSYEAEQNVVWKKLASAFKSRIMTGAVINIRMINLNGSESNYLTDALCGNNKTTPGWCPEISDSILCWPETPPGIIANQSCPPNEDFVGESHLAFKECWKNGSWYINENNITWTNYQNCLRSSDHLLEFYKCINFLYIIGYAISSVALIVSLMIFISFRTLRCTRIRIHVQLFISFTLNNILSIIWYAEVVTKVDVTRRNPYWCQFLHIAKEYFMVANYMWMFCEALHLHLALVIVFVAEEKTMKWFYGFGWGSSFLIVLVHNLIRIYHSRDTSRCYMDEIPFSTWFISAPIIITLALSMIFLINILRVILTIMHPGSPNPAPDSVRKAVRAALILTPLFGLQFIFIPVKPDVEHPMYSVHQYISMVIISYQGLCCAILFCFANHEVHQAMKRSFQRNMSFYHTRSTNYQTADSATGAMINGHVQNGHAIPLLSKNQNSIQNDVRV